MIPTLSQVCSLNSTFESDVEDYAAGQCRSLEIWFTKLEAFLEVNSLATARTLLEQHEMAASVASYQGGILASQGEQRKLAWELFDRRLNLCNELGIATLVAACDVPPPLSSTDLDRVRMSLGQAAQQAAARGVRLALEFQAAAAIGNNLQTAAALVEEVGAENLGICLDIFHFYVGPSKLTDLGMLTTDNLFHVQLCDLADLPRELAADRHRILPGEGDIPLEPVLDHLRAIGYAGPVSIELMNPQVWQVPPRQFGEIAMTALRRLLGQASME